MWGKGLLAAVFANIPLVLFWCSGALAFPVPTALAVLLTAAFFISFCFINIAPIKNRYPNKRLYVLASGCELLRVFSVSTALSLLCHAVFLCAAFPAIFPFSSNGCSARLLRFWSKRCFSGTGCFGSI